MILPYNLLYEKSKVERLNPIKELPLTKMMENLRAGVEALECSDNSFLKFIGSHIFWIKDYVCPIVVIPIVSKNALLPFKLATDIRSYVWG
jgi:hypothetical protein